MNQHGRRFVLKKGILTVGAFFTGQGLCYAKTYLTGDQARQLIFPSKNFTKVNVVLSKAQMKAIKSAAKVRVHHSKLNAYKASDGCWFIIDQVYGKHEFIDYAIGLNKDGSIKGVEILTYRESYGHQIRNPKWRTQLHGKALNSPVAIDKDIKNISGATLSCVHIVDGSRRILHTWQQVLSKA